MLRPEFKLPHTRGVFLPVCDLIAGVRDPKKKWGLWVMMILIPFYRLFTEICIAVATAIQTGIVGTDIDTFHTAACLSLISVLFERKRAVQELRK